jgi:hypothetical protein
MRSIASTVNRDLGSSTTRMNSNYPTKRKKTLSTAILILLGLLFVSAPASSFALQLLPPVRRLTHSCAKPGFASVLITLIDYPTPRCVVLTVGLDLKSRQQSVEIPPARFERMWKTFQSSGADKYIRNPTRPDHGYNSGLATVAGPNDYWFILGPNNYAVPMDKASPALKSLVKELRDFVK